MTPDLAQALAAAGLDVVPAGDVERLRAALKRIADEWSGPGTCVLCFENDDAHDEGCAVSVARRALEGTR